MLFNRLSRTTTGVIEIEALKDKAGLINRARINNNKTPSSIDILAGVIIVGED